MKNFTDHSNEQDKLTPRDELEKLAALFVLCGSDGNELCTIEDYIAELNNRSSLYPNNMLLYKMRKLNGDFSDFYAVYGTWLELNQCICDNALFETELFKALGKFFEEYCETNLGLYSQMGKKRFEEHLRKTNKISLWQFAERSEIYDFVLDYIPNPERKQFFSSPSRRLKPIHDHFGELNQAEEEILKSILEMYQTTFDYYKR